MLKARLVGRASALLDVDHADQRRGSEPRGLRPLGPRGGGDGGTRPRPDFAQFPQHRAEPTAIGAD
eukprot:9483745-Pyramimonas_sp.AAC.1